MPVGSLVQGVVSKITAFGAFVELPNGIEALVHVTEISDQPFGKIEEAVNKGDVITAKVIKLDPEHKKIALSMKEHMIDENQCNRDDIVVGASKTSTKKKKKEDEEKTAESEESPKKKKKEESEA